MYGSVSESISFLKVSDWTTLAVEQMTDYLIEASEIINNFNYCGTKPATQDDEFPRTGETTVHTQIEHATYYIALELAKGNDLETQMARLGVRNDSGGRSSIGRAKMPEHIVAGVPSVRAYNLMKPYFLPPTFSLERVS